MCQVLGRVPGTQKVSKGDSHCTDQLRCVSTGTLTEFLSHPPRETTPTLLERKLRPDATD